MVGLSLNGKYALVTGVADDVGFGWHIARTLHAAGAQVVLASHPRVVSIVERFLTRERSAESRQLPFGVVGEFKPMALLGCDVSCDSDADVPAHMRGEKGYDSDISIAGCVKKVEALVPHLDIVIHSVAFSPDIAKPIMQTTRAGYLMAQSVSSYSLIALARACLPLMRGRAGSVVGLTYLASTRAVPFYGGGMSSAKASLESDARMLSWFMGEEGHRVNLVSPGPYASRAAKSIGDISTMVDETAKRSPLRRSIDADDVANAVLFLCSDLARNVTGQTLFVDAGFSAMA